MALTRGLSSTHRLCQDWAISLCFIDCLLISYVLHWMIESIKPGVWLIYPVYNVCIRWRGAQGIGGVTQGLG